MNQVCNNDEHLWNRFYRQRWNRIVNVHGQSATRSDFVQRALAEKKPWQTHTKQRPPVADDDFTFVLSVKQRPNIPDYKYVRDPKTMQQKKVKATQRVIDDYFHVSDEYKLYNKHDARGPYRLVFEGEKKIALRSGSTTDASFTIENAVKPWGVIEDEDVERDDLSAFERLDASMYVVRHSDNAMAGIWQHVAECMQDDPFEEGIVPCYHTFGESCSVKDDDCQRGLSPALQMHPQLRTATSDSAPTHFRFETCLHNIGWPPVNRSWPPNTATIEPSRWRVHRVVHEPSSWDTFLGHGPEVVFHEELEKEERSEGGFLDAMTHSWVEWQKPIKRSR